MTTERIATEDECVQAWRNAEAIEQSAEIKLEHARRIKAAVVRQLRAQNLSLRAVGALLGVSPPTVTKYETRDPA